VHTTNAEGRALKYGALCGEDAWRNLAISRAAAISPTGFDFGYMHASIYT
jgi:hypothetical protein